MSRPLRILLIGSTGRTDCLAEAFGRSGHPNQIYALSEVHSPGLLNKCARLEVGKIDDVGLVEQYATTIRPDFAFVGQEQPIAAGVVDALQKLGIPSIAPTRNPGLIETSKVFARRLLQQRASQYNPSHRYFQGEEGLRDYMLQLQQFVIKADGLAEGKGVKVLGEHFHSLDEGMEYCRQILCERRSGFLIEEKLEGEEFSIQSFCDGTHISHAPAVQDHKRAFTGDTGPMTGGMGSYSCADHSLPFLASDQVREAEALNDLVFKSVMEESNEPYRGILYGNFIVTAKGLKLIEYNARFGDPEVMNVLPLLKNDFVDVCQAIVNGNLDRIAIEYQAKSTVCKWVVPAGYPTSPVRGAQIDEHSVPQATENLRIYFGAIDCTGGVYKLTGSRAIAFVGIADTLQQAQQIAEEGAAAVKGPVFHREDIGTEALVQKRVQHMLDLKARMQDETKY